MFKIEPGKLRILKNDHFFVVLPNIIHLKFKKYLNKKTQNLNTLFQIYYCKLFKKIWDEKINKQKKFNNYHNHSLFFKSFCFSN